MDLPFAARLLRWHVSRTLRRDPVLPLNRLDIGKVRRVLLVLTTGIGDAVFSSAVFPSLRQALPQAEIRLFCRSGWHRLFAADPNLDGVIDYPGKFRRFFATLKSLRDYRADLVLVLHGNDPDILPMCYLAGSRFIVRIPTTGTAYTDLLSNAARVEDKTTQSGLHYVANRLRILDTLGFPKGDGAPMIHASSATVAWVDKIIAARFHGRPYWVLHAFAADPYKSLPTELISSLIEKGLQSYPDVDLVLSGGKENAEALTALVPPPLRARVFVAAGRFSIDQSAACLSRARAVVAPDTGVLHLAAALGRPVIGLFAPTRSALVGPISNRVRPIVLEKPLTCSPCLQKRCPHRPVLCMGQFSADEVLAALSTALES